MDEFFDTLKKYGMKANIKKQGDRYATAITWENPPWDQKMGEGQRALIVYETHPDAGTSLLKAAVMLRLWLKNHPDIERKYNHESN